MKEKNIFRLLLLLLLVTSLWACNKEEPIKPAPPPDYTVLPAATQEGKNTFGCKVNGQVWVPRVEIFAPWFDKLAQYHEKNGKGSGLISCRLLSTSKDDFFTMAFAPNYFHLVTYKTLNDSTNLTWFNPDFRLGNEGFEHIEGDSSNFLQITAIDTLNNFISGQFRCVLYNSNRTKSLKITEGRFDMPYMPE